MVLKHNIKKYKNQIMNKLINLEGFIKDKIYRFEKLSMSTCGLYNIQYLIYWLIQ